MSTSRPLRRSLLLALASLPLTSRLAWAEPAEIDWLDMIPPDELAELMAMPEQEVDHLGDTPTAMIGTDRTVAAMDGVKGRLAGYIVPLDVDRQNRIRQCFLVPYYGACIHVPPPPGNQIVYVKPAKPVENVEIWNPYWIEGTMHIRDEKNDVASASYSFEADDVRPYL